MPKPKKQKPKPRFPLTEVRALIASGKVDFWQGALDGAAEDFGWGADMILKALNQLREKDHFKQAASHQHSWLELDFYKATIMNERVYTHFYIDDKLERLVIQSFKKQ